DQRAQDDHERQREAFIEKKQQRKLCYHSGREHLDHAADRQLLLPILPANCVIDIRRKGAGLIERALHRRDRRTEIVVATDLRGHCNDLCEIVACELRLAGNEVDLCHRSQSENAPVVRAELKFREGIAIELFLRRIEPEAYTDILQRAEILRDDLALQIIPKLSLYLVRRHPFQSRSRGIDSDLQRIAGGNDAIVDRSRLDPWHLREHRGHFVRGAGQEIGIAGAELHDHRLRTTDHVADHVVEQLVNIEMNSWHLRGYLRADVVHHRPNRRAARRIGELDEEIALIAFLEITSEPGTGTPRISLDIRIVL